MKAIVSSFVVALCGLVTSLVVAALVVLIASFTGFNSSVSRPVIGVREWR